MANRIIDWVASLESPILAFAVFVLGFGESAIGADMLVPGEVGMVVAGAAAPRAGVPLYVLIPIGIAGAMLGDLVSFLLGRRYGVALAERWRWSRRIIVPKVDTARDYFARRGPVTVFVARWVGALRAVVPFVAGASDMPIGRFVAWNVLGVSTWVTTVLTLGYVFGRSISDTVDRFSVVISISVVTIIAGWVAYRAIKARRQRAREGSSSSSAQP